jgi:hypothetical protein
MRDQIIERAADARSRREVAQIVLDGLVATHVEPQEVSLEYAKALLVDAVRAWRAGQTEGPFVNSGDRLRSTMAQSAPA